MAAPVSVRKNFWGTLQSYTSFPVAVDSRFILAPKAGSVSARRKDSIDGMDAGLEFSSKTAHAFRPSLFASAEDSSNCFRRSTSRLFT